MLYRGDQNDSKISPCYSHECSAFFDLSVDHLLVGGRHVTGVRNLHTCC